MLTWCIPVSYLMHNYCILIERPQEKLPVAKPHAQRCSDQNFPSCRWGSSLPGLRMWDPPLSPSLTCLQNHLQTSPPTAIALISKVSESKSPKEKLYWNPVIFVLLGNLVDDGKRREKIMPSLIATLPADTHTPLGPIPEYADCYVRICRKCLKRLWNALENAHKCQKMVCLKMSEYAVTCQKYCKIH